MHARFLLADVPTPALVLDELVIQRNLRRLADYTAARCLHLRPHTKTHKSQKLARLQLESGAVGLTAAKLGEAEIMAHVSDDLLLAYPALDPWRASALAKLSRRITLRVAVDSQTAVDALATAAVREVATIGILTDVDVGMGRTGLSSARAVLELAQHIDRSHGVRLDGILCYPGHIWSSPEEQAQAMAAVSDRLAQVLELWSRHGLSAAIVSGGSTPTAYQSHLIPELTEIRPGTYVFNDMNTVHGGFCALDDCAASIVCTVVSNAVPRQVVLDAGTKTLTSDRCISSPESGHGLILEYPGAKIVKLSEEHAQVDVSACDKAPRLGERVTIIPNHICPCVNLQERAWWRAGDAPLQAINIDARGQIV